VGVGGGVIVVVGKMAASKVAVRAASTVAIAATDVWVAALTASACCAALVRCLKINTAPRQATEINMIPPKMPTAIIKVRLLFDSSGSGASPKSSVVVVSSKDIKHSPGYFS
jgi:hypothetical protein